MKDLFGRLSHLQLKKEAQSDLIEIAHAIVERINRLWRVYRNNNYSLSSEETTEFRFELKTHQKRLNEYIEKYSIVKQCSRCNREFLATPDYFYKDRRVKDGLRPDCVQCHRSFQKKSYNKKVKQHP